MGAEEREKQKVKMCDTVFTTQIGVWAGLGLPAGEFV